MENVFEHITVQEHKKAVKVLCWGSSPVFIDRVIQRRGGPSVEVIIPHGFKCETKESGVVLYAETRVQRAGAKAEYRFTVKSTGIKGIWAPTPTGALDDVQDRINNTRHRRGYNGCLVVGVTYPNLQRRIREVLDVDQDPHNPENDQQSPRASLVQIDMDAEHQNTKPSCDTLMNEDLSNPGNDQQSPACQVQMEVEQQPRVKRQCITEEVEESDPAGSLFSHLEWKDTDDLEWLKTYTGFDENDTDQLVVGDCCDLEREMEELDELDVLFSSQEAMDSFGSGGLYLQDE